MNRLWKLLYNVILRYHFLASDFLFRATNFKFTFIRSWKFTFTFYEILSSRPVCSIQTKDVLLIFFNSSKRRKYICVKFKINEKQQKCQFGSLLWFEADSKFRSSVLANDCVKVLPDMPAVDDWTVAWVIILS